MLLIAIILVMAVSSAYITSEVIHRNAATSTNYVTEGSTNGQGPSGSATGKTTPSTSSEGSSYSIETNSSALSVPTNTPLPASNVSSSQTTSFHAVTLSGFFLDQGYEILSVQYNGANVAEFETVSGSGLAPFNEDNAIAAYININASSAPNLDFNCITIGLSQNNLPVELDNRDPYVLSGNPGGYVNLVASAGRNSSLFTFCNSQLINNLGTLEILFYTVPTQEPSMIVSISFELINSGEEFSAGRSVSLTTQPAGASSSSTILTSSSPPIASGTSTMSYTTVTNCQLYSETLTVVTTQIVTGETLTRSATTLIVSGGTYTFSGFTIDCTYYSPYTTVANATTLIQSETTLVQSGYTMTYTTTETVIVP